MCAMRLNLELRASGRATAKLHACSPCLGANASEVSLDAWFRADMNGDLPSQTRKALSRKECIGGALEILYLVIDAVSRMVRACFSVLRQNAVLAVLSTEELGRRLIIASQQADSSLSIKHATEIWS